MKYGLNSKPFGRKPAFPICRKSEPALDLFISKIPMLVLNQIELAFICFPCHLSIKKLQVTSLISNLKNCEIETKWGEMGSDQAYILKLIDIDN